jgi:hypothetical protein
MLVYLKRNFVMKGLDKIMMKGIVEKGNLHVVQQKRQQTPTF